jgi:hypothetical protein
VPAAVAVVAIGVLSGCDRTIEGTAAWTGGTVVPPTTGLSATPQLPTAAGPVPGIEETLPDQIPPNAFVCFPEPGGIGIGTVAQVVDTTAPRITVMVPDGWTSEPGTGDTALTLNGPDGMTGSVTIAATLLDPPAAFADYVATLARAKPGLEVVDTTGAKFCGYSSQKLIGTFPVPAGTVHFADRLTHIWTNTRNYLVILHLESPALTPGYQAAKTALMQDFAVVIP